MVTQTLTEEEIAKILRDLKDKLNKKPKNKNKNKTKTN